MSFAPANSRGIFLNARLAVNGIQCAARSFGTLTAGRGGLLSSMVASRDSGAADVRGTLSASHLWRNRRRRDLLQARAADSGHPCPGRDAARSAASLNRDPYLQEISALEWAP